MEQWITKLPKMREHGDAELADVFAGELGFATQGVPDSPGRLQAVVHEQLHGGEVRGCWAIVLGGDARFCVSTGRGVGVR